MNHELLDFESVTPANFNDEERVILERLKLFVSQRDAFSPNTIYRLEIDFRKWSKWCDAYRRQVMPINPKDFIDFIIYERERGLSSSSIDALYNSFNILLRQIEMKPMSDYPEVEREVKVTRRMALMEGEVTGQAIPFHMTDLRELTAVWENSKRPADLRNLVFIHVAYNTMMRISEVSRIKVKHLRYQDNGLVLVDVPYTKTLLSYSVKCLAKSVGVLMMKWLTSSGLIDQPDAFVFPAVHRCGMPVKVDRVMTHAALNKIFSDAWKALEKTDRPTNKGRYACWTGHSCRVGAAQDLMRNGNDLATIMKEGNWKSPMMVMYYLRNMTSQDSELINALDGEK